MLIFVNISEAQKVFNSVATLIVYLTKMCFVAIFFHLKLTEEADEKD